MKGRLWRWFLGGFLIGATGVALVWLGVSIERARWEHDLVPADSLVRAEHSLDSTTAAEAGHEQVLPGQEHDIRRSNEITEAIRHASPAVVGITVTKMQAVKERNPWNEDPYFRRFFGYVPGRIYQQPVENIGSGFIIDPNGDILTNEHVVNAATEIVVTMTDGRTCDAKVVGTDYDTDLALLKIDASGLPWIRVSDRNDMLVGEWVISIGNPFGLFKVNDQPSVSVGVISALGRDFKRQEDGRQYSNMIQTDAAINPGNSGGPLINIEGLVVGVNTFIFTGGEGSSGSIGIGFAIPGPTVHQVVETLKKRGKIGNKVWTGMSVNNLNLILSNHLHYPSLDGVVVTEVAPDGPAARAGLKPMDILMNVEKVHIDNVRTLTQYFDNHDLRVGDVLRFDIFRDGDSMTADLKLSGMHNP